MNKKNPIKLAITCVMFAVTLGVCQVAELKIVERIDGGNTNKEVAGNTSENAEVNKKTLTAVLNAAKGKLLTKEIYTSESLITLQKSVMDIENKFDTYQTQFEVDEVEKQLRNVLYGLEELAVVPTPQPEQPQPEPTQPEPTQPEPTQPEPTQPEPTQPTPTQPTPVPNNVIYYPATPESTNIYFGKTVAALDLNAVIVATTKVYDGPSKPSSSNAFKEIKTVTQGEVVKVIGISTNGYLRIELSGGIIGYIDSKTAVKQ